MSYEGVIFDLFGTLTPYVGDTEFKESLISTAEILGCPVHILEREWCTAEAFLSRVTTAEDSLAFVRRTCEVLDLPSESKRIAEAVESRLQAHRRWLLPHPTAIRTLAAIRKKGLRLGLMSVCSSEVPHLWPETPFSGCFDAVMFSCETGFLKSASEFFLKACQQMNVAPESTMYVGDAGTELTTASTLGMTPVLMRTRNQIPWDGLAVARPEEVLALLL